MPQPTPEIASTILAIQVLRVLVGLSPLQSATTAARVATMTMIAAISRKTISIIESILQPLPCECFHSIGTARDPGSHSPGSRAAPARWGGWRRVPTYRRVRKSRATSDIPNSGAPQRSAVLVQILQNMAAVRETVSVNKLQD